jgi:hypothetical protein
VAGIAVARLEIETGKPPGLFIGSQTLPGSPLFAKSRVRVTELLAMPE